MSTNVTRLGAPRSGTGRAYPTAGSAALAPVDQPQGRRLTGPQLRVAPPPPVTVPRAPFMVLVLLIVVSGVLGILLLNTKINENAFILHDLRQEKIALDQRQQRLEEEIAAASSITQLAAAARAQGLEKAEEQLHLQVSTGEVYGDSVPGSGQAAGTSRED